ncbi:hypothetical protein FRACYDRAFT_188012 [Fragilariopsis cylindrus CCMP1102]|uniref:Prolyl 4-hydroxylase alpha subunit Fe(2+) 2OG dioxygenase domain-containing protein n=1 Tax=Fragilariopsis cylindrus CCMP1102 TaxID=635003 RepID=A0A1E7F8H9_9STRA|nr:hypothetical protein FRACYDRAFT_188012 [Fragilariopsis cylindrus CCMP1102]|eukprot:OEU14434.1 hypothetical protein FRACYDRAFT_188012 [Fragilariopsis cylindrus CCMP1102]
MLTNCSALLLLLLLSLLLISSTILCVSGFVIIDEGRIRIHSSSSSSSNDYIKLLQVRHNNRRRCCKTNSCTQINQSTSSSTSSTSSTSTSSTSTSSTLVLPPIIGNTSIDRLLSKSTYDTIKEGKIAVIPNFLNAADILPLRQDAQNLWSENEYSTDALAGYGSSGKFDPTKDRAVLKLNQWKNSNLGNYKLRSNSFGTLMSNLRTELSINLNRPELNLPDSKAVTKYGIGSTEISYTRFGPGSYLKRHVDEHHEELKGKDGWNKPTRRSISWLIYLNEPGSWIPSRDGGQLRCYERQSKPTYSSRIGASMNGDLQIGWLTASSINNDNEIPVYLDAKNHNHGECAMYFVLEDNNGVGVISKRRNYITKPFKTNPILYVSGSELLVKKFLIESSDIAVRFRLIEPPKSKLDDLLVMKNNNNNANMVVAENTEEIIDDIDPFGGTLVLFDSVTLPHEVLETKNKKERWACSGWFRKFI